MRVASDILGWANAQSSAADYSTTAAQSGDLSETNLYSGPISVRHLTNYAIQLSVTGAAPTGTFVLQASNSDPRLRDSKGFPDDASAMIWTEISGSSTVVAAVGTVTWNVADAGYLYVRVVWTETPAATGAVVGRFVGKGAT